MRQSMDSDSPKSQQVEEAAVRWFMRQQSGEWTDADQACLDAWLDADMAHRIQYLRVTYAWEQSARMKALGAGVSPGVIPPRMAWGDRRFSRRASPGTHSPAARVNRPNDVEAHDADTVIHLPEAPVPEVHQGARGTSAKAGSRLRFFIAAASLVMLVGAMYVLYASLLAGTRYSTSIGGIENVTLGDGSKLTLNTDTRLRVILGQHERRIRLDRGEAFFEVAKDPKRPFVVYVGDNRVMAVGTKFSVRRNDDDVQVIVTEGRVRLATAATASTEMADQLAGRMAEVVAGGIERERARRVSNPSVAFLDAGAIARTLNAEVLVRPEAEAEAEKLLSWRLGYVSFDNVTLAQAVAEFNRYNETQIVIDDPAIGSFLVGGNFRSNNTSAFLDLLQSGFPIAVEQRGNEVILKSR